MANEALRLIGSGSHFETAPAGDELNLRELWRALNRRRFVLIAVVALLTSAAYAYSKQQTPLYTAETLVRITDREAQVIQIDGIVDEMIADEATIGSEVQLLKSRDFARRMVEQFNLTEDPEFNPALRPEGETASLLSTLDPMQYIPEAWLEALAPSGTDTPSVRDQISPEVITELKVIDAFRSRLNVAQVGDTLVLRLTFTSADPSRASAIANAAAEEYLVSQVEAKFEAAERATSWLSERIDALRGEVLEAEAKIVEYRSQNNLVENETSPAMMQLTQLNTQLALSQAQRAEAEARLSQTQSLLVDEAGVSAAAKVLDSAVMTNLRDREAEVLREISILSSELGPNHPQIISARDSLQSIYDKMEDEVRRIVQDLGEEVAVARAREAELQRSLATLQNEEASNELAEVGLNNLIREANANRELFETFLQRFREIVEQQKLLDADARILSSADIPLSPSHPRTLLFTAIALGCSLVLGTLLVFLLERWDADYGFRSAEEIQSAIGARALALVPDLTRRETQGVAAEDYVLQKPNSAFAEALQRIRTSLFLADNGHVPKTVLITSSVPLEGKSTIAAALARQSARSGLKVILIDADLRRPRLHEVIGLPNENGLSEVLTGRANPEAAIKRDEHSGLDFLPAGVGVVSPPDLFRSSTMKILLEEMAAYYDLVIIDSPPVAAVADSFTLSGLVDKSVYVVRWEQTPRNVALSGIRQMVEAGADIAGVVLSRVNIKKHARYGYADSGHYQGSYRRYYVN